MEKSKLLALLCLLITISPSLALCQPIDGAQQRINQSARIAEWRSLNGYDNSPQVSDPMDGLMGDVVESIGNILLQEWENSQTKVECVQGDCRNGKSIEITRQEQVHWFRSGNFQNGKLNGYGTFGFFQGDNPVILAEGHFSNNRLHGEGISTEYRVSRRQDFVSSRASVRLLNSYYSGKFVNGNRHGKGMYVNVKGIKEYDGHWKNNQRDGMGTSYFDNGYPAYKGQWQNDQKHGTGTEYHANGKVKYKGRFEYGHKTGEAKVYDQKGRMVFDGELKLGEARGEGTYYLKNGDQFEGKWDYRPSSEIAAATVDGKVTNASGKVVKRVKVRDQTEWLGYYNKAISILDINLVGGWDVVSRFQGMGRDVFGTGMGFSNFEFRLGLRGPQFLQWGRINPHIWTNSRAYSFNEIDGQSYGALLFDTTGTGTIYNLRPHDNENGYAVIVRNREFGAGLSGFFPIKENLSLELGTGLIFAQGSTLQFSKNDPFQAAVSISKSKFRNVLFHQGKDWYLDTGIRFGLLRLGLRTLVRAPVETRPNFPIYTRTESNGDWQRVSVGHGKRVGVQFNMAFSFPLGQVKSEKDRLRKYLPFEGASYK